MNKKKEQLGVAIGTASAQLKKMILFDLLKQLKQNICYQCKKEIESCNELSIEHKIPYLDSQNPTELFFDLKNIAFSHFICNCGAARQTKVVKHPSFYAYTKGCRCEECTELNRLKRKKYRDKT